MKILNLVNHPEKNISKTTVKTSEELQKQALNVSATTSCQYLTGQEHS